MRKILITLVAVMALFGLSGGGYALASSALSTDSPTGLRGNGTIGVCVKDSTHGWYARTGVKCGKGYHAVTFNQKGIQGPDGPAGPAGKDLTVTSANASTALSNRDDSSSHGTWAKDAMVRTASVTRGAPASAAKCGASAAKCWFYTGAITDAGSFRTVDGAKAPHAGTDIAGNVAGVLTGGSDVEFYSSDPSPDGSLLPAIEVGTVHTTMNWVRQFFPAAAAISAPKLINWRWSYSAPGTCEIYVQAVSGETGDIRGVNDCT